MLGAHLRETASLSPTGRTVCFSHKVRGHAPNSRALYLAFCKHSNGGRSEMVHVDAVQESRTCSRWQGRGREYMKGINHEESNKLKRARLGGYHVAQALRRQDVARMNQAVQHSRCLKDFVDALRRVS